MSVRTDVINLNVNINGDVGKKELNDLRSRASQLTAEMRGLKKSTQEYKDKALELQQVTSRITELKKQIGLTALSQKELTQELKKLQQQKNLVTPQTEEFKRLQGEIDKVQARLKEVRTGKFGIAAFWDGIKDEVKQFGILAAGYLGFDFVVGQTKNIIQMQARMSREYADIRKTTSLSVSEVKLLDKELRKLDTPSSNSRLRQLAAEAGKLGIDGVADLKKFVKEADQIDVALGEDLGDEGLNKIAKLSGILKTGMLNIASGVNAVGQASAASEPYLVDFSFRMAGTAQTAKIAAGDLLGYASALEVNGQTSEVSGTALNKFLLEFIANTETFGKAAGMAKGELTKLVNTQGVNEAFLEWLQKLKDSSKTTDEFINKMNKLGIDGARGAGVFLVMANNIGQIHEQQELANKAVAEGTSVTNEFEVRAQSFDAVVQRLGKSFNAFFTSDTINGWVKKAVYSLEGLLSLIRSLAEFIDKNRLAIMAWVAAGLVQFGVIQKLANWIKVLAVGTKDVTAAQVLNTIATKAEIVAVSALGAAKALLTGNTAKLRQEIKLLTTALGTNPWTALLLVVGALLVAFRNLGAATSKTKMELEGMARVNDQVNEQMGETINKERLYLSILKDRNTSEETKRQALKDLIALNPVYLSGLTQQNVVTAEGTRIIDDYNKMLVRKLQLEASAANSAKIYQDLLKKQSLLQQAEYLKAQMDQGGAVRYSDLSDDLKDVYKRSGPNGAVNALKSVAAGAASIGDLELGEGHLKDIIAELKYELPKATDQYNASVKLNTKLTDENTKALKANLDVKEAQLKSIQGTDKESEKERSLLQGQIADLKNQLGITDVPTGTMTAGGAPEKHKKTAAEREAERAAKELARIKSEIEALNNEITAKESDFANNTKVRDEQEIARVVNKYAKLLTEAKKFTAQAAQLNELEARELDLLYEQQFQRRSSDEYEQSLKDLKGYFDQRQATIDTAYANGEITLREYNLRSQQLDKEEADDRLTIASDYAATVKKAADDVEAYKTAATKKGVEERRRLQEHEAQDEIERAKRKVLTARKGSQEELQAKKDLLQEQYDQEVKSGQYSNDQLLTMKEEMYKNMQDLDQDYFQNLARNISEAFNALGSIMTSFFDVMKNGEDAELARYQKSSDKKKDRLQKQLDAGIISQAKYNQQIAALDEQLDAKQKELQIRQAKRDKAARMFSAIINTATAVTSALTAGPFIGAVLAALYAALGAVQIAAIASEPLPKGRKGLVVEGPSHEQNGITMIDNNTGRPLAEIEGGEPVMVLSKNTYGNNKNLIDELLFNSNYRNGARVAAADWYHATPRQISSEVLPVMQGGGVVQAQGQLLASYSSNNELLEQLVYEQRQTRVVLLQQKKSIRAHVVLRDIDDQGKLRDKAKSLSGIRQ